MPNVYQLLAMKTAWADDSVMPNRLARSLTLLPLGHTNTHTFTVMDGV